MIFLQFLKLSTWLSDAGDGIMGGITTALRTLMFWLDTFIYNLIIDLYDIFNKLCTARLLDNTVLNAISQRVGLVLGLIMFFSVVFSFIQMLIDPDKISDKEKGAVSIIKKSLIVIVMLGTSNFVFQSLYKVQSLVIEENVISKLILPYQVVDSSDTDNFGNILSKELMSAFYQVDTFDNVIITDNKESNKRDNCTTVRIFFLEQIEKNSRFELGYTCLNESIKVEIQPSPVNATSYEDEIYMINFNGILSVLAGVVVAYVLFMYCFGVGVRMVQLAFLEIISPMAIVSYLSPKKDNMFGKWWKIYFSTYIDVFLRIAIINFVIFLIMTLFASSNNGQFIFWETLGNPTGTGERSFFMVIIVIALLTFAKKAPDLLKELFPAGASKLGLGVSMKDFVGLQKGFKIGSGILGGAVGGAAVGFLGSRTHIGGLVGGMLKGGLSGFKGQGLGKTAASAWKTQSKMNKTMADVRANGGSAFGYHMNQLQQGFGIRTAADRYNMEKSDLERENAAYKAYDSYIDAAEKRAEAQILKGKFADNINVQKALEQKNLAEIYRQQSANIKRSDYDTESEYKNALTALANEASKADSAYLVAMKEAKKDYISAILRGNEEDAPTLQNLQQAAGVVDANSAYDYNFVYDVKDEDGNVIETKPLTGADLLAGDYDRLDSANSHAKEKQTENNNRIAKNQTEGAAARANAGK